MSRRAARGGIGQPEQSDSPSDRWVRALLLSRDSHPPGIPAVVPGEQLNDAVIDYLRSGKAAGMAIPDATDPTLQYFRVSDAG